VFFKVLGRRNAMRASSRLQAEKAEKTKPFFFFNIFE
jgi:hypothetical protein